MQFGIGVAVGVVVALGATYAVYHFGVKKFIINQLSKLVATLQK